MESAESMEMMVRHSALCGCQLWPVQSHVHNTRINSQVRNRTKYNNTLRNINKHTGVEISIQAHRNIDTQTQTHRHTDT